MGQKPVVVMKFGGSVLEDSESFHRIAQLVARRQSHAQLVVVLSAMRGVTDRLIQLAQQIHPEPPRREYDMLVSVGERLSIPLLAMALDVQGISAVSFTGSQSGVITTGDHAEAKIIDIAPTRIRSALQRGQIAIVAGFQGVSHDREITTLGRGGSDTTAVALGIALKASVVQFYKDVAGIYPHDPHQEKEVGTPYPFLDFEAAREIIERTGGKVLHPRALDLAARNSLPLQLLSCREAEGTWIGTAVSHHNPHPIYETCRCADHHSA